MCGRFALFVPIEQLAEEYELTNAPELEPRYNIAPSQSVLAVRESRQGERLALALRWGLVPHWAKDAAIGNRMINARAETVATKPAYREAFKRRRCIIPASGFYEWGPSAAGRWPRFIRAQDAPLLSLAALWERWARTDAEPLETCAIVTVAANPTVAPVHERMPLCLTRASYDAWLSPETSLEACQRLLAAQEHPALEVVPVGKAVNNPRNEHARLIEPVEIPSASAG
ncbi:MAG TPA: SOS response-associated peptidase [Gammaproteobacteria bacterium]|nr:SOS response-associated peptidase [Gammaproteobacteria bacterium]